MTEARSVDTGLSLIRTKCAKKLLELYYTARAGHIGCSLSCLEILVDLLCSRMTSKDILILSKGHAAAGLYVTLAESGRIDAQELNTFYKNGTRLAAHPPCSGEIPAIPFGTGSLGHGLSLAAGLAFSQKFTGRTFNVYCVLSDGECNEGSTWEAALFAAHHQLSQLTVIVDRNHIQGIGPTEEVLNMEPFADKWRSFGFDVAPISNGNNFIQIENGFQELKKLSTSGPGTRPKCLIAETTKGHGVSYMEDKMEWHYLPMTEQQYEQALKELSQAKEQIHA